MSTEKVLEWLKTTSNEKKVVIKMVSYKFFHGKKSIGNKSVWNNFPMIFPIDFEAGYSINFEAVFAIIFPKKSKNFKSIFGHLKSWKSTPKSIPKLTIFFKKLNVNIWSCLIVENIIKFNNNICNSHLFINLYHSINFTNLHINHSPYSINNLQKSYIKVIKIYYWPYINKCNFKFENN